MKFLPPKRTTVRKRGGEGPHRSEANRARNDTASRPGHQRGENTLQPQWSILRHIGPSESDLEFEPGVLSLNPTTCQWRCVTVEGRAASLPPTALSTPFRDNWHLTARLLRSIRKKATEHKATSPGPAKSLFLSLEGDCTTVCWWAQFIRAPDTYYVLGL